MVAVVIAVSAVVVAGATASIAATAAPGYKAAGGWGKVGAGHGPVRRQQRGLATDKAGNVYVADDDNNRVQVFTAKGAFLAHVGHARNRPRPVLAGGRHRGRTRWIQSGWPTTATRDTRSSRAAGRSRPGSPPRPASRTLPRGGRERRRAGRRRRGSEGRLPPLREEAATAGTTKARSSAGSPRRAPTMSRHPPTAASTPSEAGRRAAETSCSASPQPGSF